MLLVTVLNNSDDDDDDDDDGDGMTMTVEGRVILLMSINQSYLS